MEKALTIARTAGAAPPTEPTPLPVSPHQPAAISRSSRVVVRVEGVSKRYRLGQIGGGSLREDLQRWWAKSRGAPDPMQTVGETTRPAAQGAPMWALCDVSFDVSEGEILGIVGRNGAGKSTLLKILSRITAPTTGSVKIRGHLGSLLEVGTGFHPELTGRENIYLNGAILGMKKAAIDRQLEEIIDFSEIGAFIDTPVKRYSSGMYVRLAFAVAAHLDPEILIVDEVLAVGDARFQKRCLGKMKDVARQGRTVLFVSHNMLAVQRLCSRAVWLDGGHTRADGDAQEVIGAYLRDGVPDQLERVWDHPETAPGNASFAIARLAVEPLVAAENRRLSIATGARLIFEYWNRIPNAALNLSLHVYSSDDTLVLNALPLDDPNWFGKEFPEGRFRCICDLPPHLLNADKYRVELLAVRDQHHVIYQDDRAIGFELDDVPMEGAWYQRLPGVVRPRVNWRTERLS